MAGVRKTKTFDTKAAAKGWASMIEAEIRAQENGEMPPNLDFSSLLKRYADEVSPGKKAGDFEALRIKALIRDDPLADVPLTELNETDVAAWRDRRLKSVAPASVLREWTIYSNACNVARKEWKWLRRNPFSDVKRPAQPTPRSRTITPEEVEKLLLCLGTDKNEVPTTMTARVGWAFLFALETGMRSGEICALNWADVSDKTVTVLGEAKRAGKSGNRVVPLTVEARRILTMMPSGMREEGDENTSDSVFEIEPALIDALFRKAKLRAGLSGLRFHDARRTALTRMAKSLSNPMDLAKVSGHKDLRILLSVYYAPDMEAMADRIG
jgi:integrase